MRFSGVTARAVSTKPNTRAMAKYEAALIRKNGSDRYHCRASLWGTPAKKSGLAQRYTWLSPKAKGTNARATTGSVRTPASKNGREA